MSVSCTKPLTIVINSTGDMPLDQAVYAGGARDAIYGVRGGYVFEFNATSGALVQSYRFVAPAFSDASIAYDSVNDRLFVSIWQDKAFANGGDTNFDIIPIKKLYRLDPDTLFIDGSAEINGEVGFPGYIGNDEQHIGPHRILYDGGLIYCASAGNSASRLCTVDVNTLAIVTNGESLSWPLGQWLDFCIQPAGSEPLQVWINTPDRYVNPCAAPPLTYFSSSYFYYKADDYAPPYNIIYGVCWCPTNGKIYGTCRKPTVVSFAPSIVGSPFALTNIATGDTNATPYRIAFNPYDNLIYVPGFKSNNVVVINPATDACTIKTGFDSPFDVVFTPTKKWAVQQGTVPLKEIV